MVWKKVTTSGTNSHYCKEFNHCYSTSKWRW